MVEPCRKNEKKPDLVARLEIGSLLSRDQSQGVVRKWRLRLVTYTRQEGAEEAFSVLRSIFPADVPVVWQKREPIPQLTTAPTPQVLYKYISYTLRKVWCSVHVYLCSVYEPYVEDKCQIEL